MAYQDKGATEATCVDCGEKFYYNAEFYADKGLSNPKRCKACRAKKKAEREGR